MQKDTQALSFEAALSELEGIVKGLERGETDLEKSITAFERGMALKAVCEKKLKDAQGKIEKITLGADGKVKTEAFNLEG